MFVWQKFDKLGNALQRLNEAIARFDIDPSEYVQDSIIQRFEFVVELYWKVLKMALLAFEKVQSAGPRDVMSKAYSYRLIDDESAWIDMLDARNSTSHIYDQAEAQAIVQEIKTIYAPVLNAAYKQLESQYKELRD